MKKYDEKEFKSACLAFDYGQIISYLSEIDDGAELFARYKDIFEDGKYYLEPKMTDKRIAPFLRLYEDYMKWVIFNKPTTDECKKYLADKLSVVFPKLQSLSVEDAWDTLTDLIKDFFAEKGYFSQFGITPPYPELYLWAKENKQRQIIELPESVVEIEVCAIEDVIIGGLYDCLSMGKVGAAGWVTKEGCTYFVHKYDTGSDDFNISLLKHEGQHFLDLEKYPEMKSVDLEYRAKLVELIYHKQMDLFYFFLNSMADSDDSNYPHALAQRRIIKGLSRKIFDIELEVCKDAWADKGKQIQEFSLELLKEHSEKLKEEN